MIPVFRIVTSGLYCQLSGSGTSEYVYQLYTRTLYGQLFAQYRVPTQRLAPDRDVADVERARV